MTNVVRLVIVMQNNTSVPSKNLLVRLIEFTRGRNRLFLIILLLCCAAAFTAAPVVMSAAREKVDSAWNSGWRAWRAGDAQTALDCWSSCQYLSRLAPRPARMLYWRVRALDKLGRYYEAEALRLRMGRLYPADFYTFMLYPDGGYTAKYFKTSAREDDFNHPRPWRETVASASRTTGISEITIWSVMKRESKFRPWAVSRSGAVGLMQLMPSTAKDIAAHMGLKLTDLKEPSQNIMLGAGYYASLNKKFDGEIIRTVAAYNAGARAVSSWAALSSSDWAEWVENIPYRETREFVRSVLENRETYRIVYRNDKHESLYSFVKTQPMPVGIPVLANRYINR